MIDDKKLKMLLKHRNPDSYEYKYIVKFETDDIIPMGWTGIEYQAEEIYRKCLETGKTWREVAHYKEPDLSKGVKL